jgi:hypothetical protein
MNKLTAQDLRDLKPGEKVYRVTNDQTRRLEFVGPIPSCKNYLIFCDGEYLTYLYISDMGEFRDEWYGGEYDSKFLGLLRIEKLKKEIKSVNRIYVMSDKEFKESYKDEK